MKYNFNFYKISLIFSDICIHFPKIFTKDIQPFCLEIFIAQSFPGICNSLLQIFIINFFVNIQDCPFILAQRNNAQQTSFTVVGTSPHPHTQKEHITVMKFVWATIIHGTSDNNDNNETF